MPGILLNSFTAVANRHRRCSAGSSASSSQFYSTNSVDTGSTNSNRRGSRTYHHLDSSGTSTSSRRSSPSSTASNSAMNTPARSSSPERQEHSYTNEASATSTSKAHHASRRASLWGTEIPNTEPNMTWGQFIDFDTSSTSF